MTLQKLYQQEAEAEVEAGEDRPSHAIIIGDSSYAQSCLKMVGVFHQKLAMILFHN